MKYHVAPDPPMVCMTSKTGTADWISADLAGCEINTMVPTHPAFSTVAVSHTGIGRVLMSFTAFEVRHYTELWDQLQTLVQFCRCSALPVFSMGNTVHVLAWRWDVACTVCMSDPKLRVFFILGHSRHCPDRLRTTFQSNIMMLWILKKTCRVTTMK